ncbi:MAG: phosphoglycerate dehydrogenase [Planctomycetota bacterium]
MGLSFPRSKIKILLLEGIHENAVEHFQRAGYTAVKRLAQALSGDELIEHLRKAHVVGIRSRTQLTADVLSEAKRLLAVGCFCIGTNQVDLDAAALQGVPVFNAPHSNTRSVAELVIGELVMLFRGLGDKHVATHEGRWTKSASGSRELRGKTLGIVGYGHIGSQVSILAEAMGLRVLYYDVEPKLAMGLARPTRTLKELLEASDAVTLHVPEAPSTRGMFDAERVAQLKPGAFLLNASRGSVVDLEALAAAIKAGKVGGAAVDVFPKEPRGKDEPFRSPLQGLPNVILTPHIGGSTQEAQENIGVEVASKLVAYSDHGSSLGAVNFPNISLTPQPGAAHRLLHVHENRPGMLAAINRVLGDEDVNILGQHLQTNRQVGFVVADVDREHNPDLLERLRQLPGTIRCRILC